MLTKNISLKNFHIKKINKNVKKDLKNLLQEKNTIIESLSISYKNGYSKKIMESARKKKKKSLMKPASPAEWHER